MQVNKKDLDKSQVELSIEVVWEELAPFLEKGANNVSAQVKIEGFRPGKVPYEVLKQKIGEMTILEEAANLFINKNLGGILEKNMVGQNPVGQPRIEITKLAPENPMELKMIVAFLPTIALGKYKDLNIKVDKISLEKGELEKAMKDLAEMRAQETIVEEAAQDGDKLIVDIDMFLDKVPVEGGQSKDLAILLGREYFVPGFDKKLEGAKKGDERSFQLPYPENHHQTNLAGKMVDFSVKIKEVYRREIPKLDDEFAAVFQFKNIKDLEKVLEDNIIHEKEHELEHKQEAQMLDLIIEDTKFGDLPEVLLENETRHMMSELEHSLEHQGLKLSDYLIHLKKTQEQFMLDLTPSAVKRVKSALILREIAVVEKVLTSEAELDKKIAEMKEANKGNEQAQETFKQPSYRSYLENALTNEKIMKQLKEWNYVHIGDKQKS